MPCCVIWYVKLISPTPYSTQSLNFYLFQEKFHLWAVPPTELITVRAKDLMDAGNKRKQVFESVQVICLTNLICIMQ